MYILLAFLLVPIIEIAMFIQVGGLIGLWPTLGIVIATAFLGTYLVRSQGRAALARLSGAFSDLSNPAEPLVDGAMILFAGALLLTPGFFTDAVGFALLTPGIRRRVFAEMRKRINVQGFSYGHPTNTGDRTRHPAQPDIIDGEYEDLTPPRNPGTSGWTNGSNSGH